MRFRPELFEFDKNPQQHTAADELYAQHRAVYKSMREDPLLSYWQGIEVGAPQAMKADRQEGIQEQLESAREATQEAVLHEPSEVHEIAEASLDVEQEIVEQENNVFFTYENLLEQFAADNEFNFDDDHLEYLAEQATYAVVLASVFDQSWKGTAKDLLGYLVAPNLSFIASDVMDMGSWWSSGRDMQAWNRSFRGLPVEERIDTFLALVDAVKERTPNATKAMEIITGLISDEGYESAAMYQALDKLGVVGYAVDATTLGAGLARRVANPIRMAKRMNDEITAARLAEAALENPQIAEAIGVDAVSAGAHFSPVRLAPQLFDGATDFVQSQVARDVARQRETFATMEGSVLPEGIRTLTTQGLARARAERQIVATEVGQAVSDVRIVETTPRSMVVQYNVVTPDSPSLAPDLGPNAPDWQREALRLAEQTGDSWRSIATTVGKPRSTVSDFLRKNYYPRQQLQGPAAPAAPQIKTVTMPLTVDDIARGINPLDHKLRMPVISWFQSAVTKFKNNYEALGKTMQRGMFQTGPWRTMFAKEYNRIIRVAPREQQEKVGRILQEGNLHVNPDGSFGKVFNANELRGKGLTDQGMIQYFEFRALMDQAHRFKNMQMADMHMVAGHRMYNFDSGPGPVKMYDEYSSAATALTNTNTRQVAVFRGTEMEVLTARGTDGAISPKLKQYMDEGMVLLRPMNDSNTYVRGDKGYNFVLGYRAETSEITRSTPMLAYNEGYLPIFYGPAGGANYFGQHVRHATIDGVHKPVARDTKVYFDSRTDAEAWARRENIRHFEGQEMDTAAAVARTDTGTDLPYSWKRDREVERAEFDTWYAGSPYTGHRAPERLKRGLGEDSAEYIDPFTSIQRYLDNIANQMPLAAYRIGLEDAWLKHAKEMGAIPNNWFGPFSAALPEMQKASRIDAPVRQFLTDSHNHISFNNRVPSMGEEASHGVFMHLAERMEKLPFIGNDGHKGHTYLHRLAQKDVPGTIRATTFHMLLGLLSPAQLFVQGSGASIALSMDPINALKGLPYAVSFMALDNIPDGLHRAAVLKRVESSYPGLSTRYNAWRKTGLYDSIISSSGDYRSLVGSHPVGVDKFTRVTGTAGKVADKAALPYKAGELVNRRISFATAIERHLAKGGKLDDDGIKQAMNIANDFMLNMDRAMKGDFQKGWWGVPTQFMQVHTKFLETLFNKQFSRWERGRMVAMQVALYGGMGVPIPFVATNVLNRFIDEDTPDEWVTGANEGMVGYLLREMMGFDNEVVSRVAIPFGIEDTFNNMFLENPGIWDVLPGASSSIPNRAVELGKALHGVFLTSQWDDGNIDPAKAQIVGRDLLKFLTSGRGAVEAYQLWANDEVYNKRGIQLHTNDLNVQSIIARGAGFQLSEVQDMFTVFRSKQHVQKRVTQYSDMIMDHMARRMNVEGMRGSSGQAEDLGLLVSHMMSREPIGISQQVREEILRRITSPESAVDKANRDQIELMLNDLWDYAMSTRSTRMRGE